MLYKNNSPGKLTEAVPLLTCIRKAPAPNIGDDTKIMTQVRWHYMPTSNCRTATSFHILPSPLFTHCYTIRSYIDRDTACVIK
jgi:hypothetical protein